MRLLFVIVMTALTTMSPSFVSAQSTPTPAEAGSATVAGPSLAPPPDDTNDDLWISQADFTVITLPTTLRLGRHKGAFRVTHRFERSLGQGDFGSLAEDFFSLDGGAIIGLEYRYGLIEGGQVGLRRTSDRTIAFFGQYSVLQQSASRPLGVDVVAAVDGTNNFRDEYSPSVGVAVSRAFGTHGAVYFDPTWVGNTNVLPRAVADDNSTLTLGVGARVRVRPTVYLVAEIIPRVGYRPGVNHATFGVEKRVGGHVFQLNFSNGFGTTISQVARGGTANDDWYMGFNLSRKF